MLWTGKKVKDVNNKYVIKLNFPCLNLGESIKKGQEHKKQITFHWFEKFK